MLTTGPEGVSATVSVCLTPAPVGTTPAARVSFAERVDADAGTTSAEEGTP